MDAANSRTPISNDAFAALRGIVDLAEYFQFQQADIRREWDWRAMVMECEGMSGIDPTETVG
ncbi:hypothetical protein [Methylomonas koyamae]|uniref:hypothetical protein n=1 Tax=Methylomonas koyamae TaxID=702114 RepID=UPI000A679BC0|nr:hypothetical protein [Methylomonas koyamae]BBL56726.1 hypothetical protein MKFW12EY_03390 [Methylomonas koyamae]